MPRTTILATCLLVLLIGVMWLARHGMSGPTSGPAPASRPGPDAVIKVLNDFHEAASNADEERYFGLMSDQMVFLGTDASERWTKDQFRAYAKPFFDQARGWTYVAIPGRRFVTISKDGSTAWFDEAIKNAKYGECRGSGVLVREGDAWKIAQYNLTVPVPNDMLEQVAKDIQAKGAKK